MGTTISAYLSMSVVLSAFSLFTAYQFLNFDRRIDTSKNKMRPSPSCVHWRLFAYMMEIIATCFFFAYCVSNFECWFYCEKALHTAITDAVYCVKLVACDRRVANKLRKGLDKALHKSYNTTPAEERRSSSLLLAVWLFWPHVYHLFLWSWPHVAVGMFLLYSPYVFSPTMKQFSSTSTTSNWWPHIIFSDTDLTTSLTINRTGVHGDKMSREYEKAVFA